MYWHTRLGDTVVEVVSNAAKYQVTKHGNERKAEVTMGKKLRGHRKVWKDQADVREGAVG